MALGPFRRGPVIGVQVQDGVGVAGTHRAEKMMKELDELVVAPVDEVAEGPGIEVHFPGDVEAGVLVELPGAEPAAAGRDVGRLVVGAPVDVVEVEPVDVQVVHEIAQALGQPVAEGRVEAEPALVLGKRPAVVDKLHEPLRMQVPQRLGEVDRVVGQHDDAALVTELDEAGVQLLVQVGVRREDARGETGRAAIECAGDDGDLESGCADGVHVLLGRGTIQPLPGGGRRIVGFDAAYPFFVGLFCQAPRGASHPSQRWRSGVHPLFPSLYPARGFVQLEIL